MTSACYPLWSRLTCGAAFIVATYLGFMLPGLAYAHCASAAQWHMQLSQWLAVQLLIFTFPLTLFMFVTIVLLISNVSYYIRPSRVTTFWAIAFAMAVPVATFACAAPRVLHSCV